MPFKFGRLQKRLTGQIFHRCLSKSQRDNVSTVSDNEYGLA